MKVGEEDVQEPQSTAASQPQERWTCPRCEEPNKMQRERCNNCDAPKPGTEVPSQPPKAKAQTPPPEKWTCPKCDEPNKAERDCCNNCGWVKRSKVVVSIDDSDEDTAPPAPTQTAN